MCHSKQAVSGEPLTPAWLPMTSTVRAHGLLHFSLQPMTGTFVLHLKMKTLVLDFMDRSACSSGVFVVCYTDGCASARNSLTYQQGEALFLEASVAIPLHPPLQLYVDSCTATLEPDPSSLPSYTFIAKNGYICSAHSQFNNTYSSIIQCQNRSTNLELLLFKVCCGAQFQMPHRQCKARVLI